MSKQKRSTMYISNSSIALKGFSIASQRARSSATVLYDLSPPDSALVSEICFCCERGRILSNVTFVCENAMKPQKYMHIKGSLLMIKFDLPRIPFLRQIYIE